MKKKKVVKRKVAAKTFKTKIGLARKNAKSKLDKVLMQIPAQVQSKIDTLIDTVKKTQSMTPGDLKKLGVLILDRADLVRQSMVKQVQSKSFKKKSKVSRGKSRS